jgi:hypothetical protein
MSVWYIRSPATDMVGFETQLMSDSKVFILSIAIGMIIEPPLTVAPSNNSTLIGAVSDEIAIGLKIIPLVSLVPASVIEADAASVII